ncbi:hypothetical protein PR048_017743 [Dryococelus australis]|uniref:PiggyBac transposable element-derived protein domain-containing protein n=1 Tax=Dryococelus australis TaxID=614101 RepID=A0ABQ9HAC7_9NEOP|nr:hypothetical protein PR048_017743 [Dryococelus australis]
MSGKNHTTWAHHLPANFQSNHDYAKIFQILRILRFNNRETCSSRKQNDKFAAIHDLWTFGAFVIVDQQLVAFRGNCPFRQYCGLKFCILCDNETSYVWNIQPYTGKQPNQPSEENRGLRVVLELSYGLKGHNITFDNAFKSYELGQMLLKITVTMIGTVRKNKPSIPTELLNTKNKEVFSSTFAFTNNTMLVSYVPVVVQSTFHFNKNFPNSVSKKPQAILDYNQTKGAVDTYDKMVSCYTSKRKTKRWPVVVFSNFVDISAVNGYILFTKVNPNWKQNSLAKRRLFLENLGISLVQIHI